MLELAFTNPSLTEAIESVPRSEREAAAEQLVRDWLSQPGGEGDWKDSASAEKIREVRRKMVRKILEAAE